MRANVAAHHPLKPGSKPLRFMPSTWSLSVVLRSRNCMPSYLLILSVEYRVVGRLMRCLHMGNGKAGGVRGPGDRGGGQGSCRRGQGE